MSRFIPNENTFVGVSLGVVGLMSPPATATATDGGASTGTLPASAVAYIVTGVNATGETKGSSAATVTPAAANSSAVLTWAAVAGATGYRIYGRTAGSESLLNQVGNVLTWTDSGSLTPGVAVPPTKATASNTDKPTAADINGAIEITSYVTGLNFGTTGSAVPTPDLKRLFETSIEGTVTGSAQFDCYRDDELDTAWTLLPRGTVCTVLISRFGGIPASGDGVEVYPVRVTSRTNANLANNTPATFTTTFAMSDEPSEDAIVQA